MFVDTRTFLKAIGDRLIALTWTPAGGSAQPVFERVAYYDSARTAEALQALLSFEDRMAVIIPDSTSYRTRIDPEEVFAVRKIAVDILFTGRNNEPTDEAAAYLGMIEQANGTWTVNPQRLGIIGMADLVVNDLTGKRLAGADPLLPTFGEPVELAEKEQSTVRKSFLLSFEAEAGDHEFTIL
jgi:hypothetical protein